MSSRREEDIKFGLALAGLGYAITFHITSHPLLIFAALPLAGISGYLVLRHI
jgi:hypothetical protein